MDQHVQRPRDTFRGARTVSVIGSGGDDEGGGRVWTVVGSGPTEELKSGQWGLVKGLRQGNDMTKFSF